MGCAQCKWKVDFKSNESWYSQLKRHFEEKHLVFGYFFDLISW